MLLSLFKSTQECVVLISGHSNPRVASFAAAAAVISARR